MAGAFASLFRITAMDAKLAAGGLAASAAIGGGVYGIGKAGEASIAGNCADVWSGSNSTGDWFSGFAHGFLSIAGAGSLVDPMTKLQGEISSTHSDIQDLYNKYDLMSAINTTRTEANELKVIESNKQIFKRLLNLTTTITNENLGRVNITLTSIGLLSLLIVFYLLFTK